MIVCRTAVVVLSLVPVLFGPQAFACSPLPPETEQEHAARVLEAFDSAYSVVIADAIDVKHTKISTIPRDIDIVERASMKVVEVLKGPSKVGDRVSVETRIVCCNCNVSVKNDPPWAYEIEQARDGTQTDRPVKFSGRWLLIAYDDKPVSLGDSGPSFAWEFGGELNAEMLRAVLKSRKESRDP
jgi:hypothetical protein